MSRKKKQTVLVRWIEEYAMEIEVRDPEAELVAGLPDEDLSYAEMTGSRNWTWEPWDSERGTLGEPRPLEDSMGTAEDPGQREYRESGMAKCPDCGSDDISSGEPVVDGSQIWVPVTCGTCGAQWKDCYAFSAFEK